MRRPDEPDECDVCVEVERKMPEQMPPTGLTLAGAKQYLSDNFEKHTIKKTSELYFGLDVWDVKALEKVPTIDSLRRRNFRLYTAGLDDTAKAWWEATQGPMSPPAPPTPEPTFLDGARAFLRAEVKADRIKAGELIYGDDEMERATATVIDSGKKEKRVLIKRVDAIFSMEDYVHLSDVTEVIAK